MLAIGFKITIGSLVFNYASSVEIKHTWKEATSTCVLKFPRNLKLREQELKSYIKAGEKVAVYIGYDGDLNLEFNGYVRAVKNTTPVEIHCEDQMYMLKKGTITQAWRNASLRSILSVIYSGEVKVFDAEIGAFTLNRTTPAIALDEIKTSTGLHSFFRNGVLVCGIQYDRETASVHKYHFQKNVVENRNLEFQDKADVRLKIRAISILPNNQKIEIELGDKDGQERTLHFSNLKKPALQAMAEKEAEKLYYSGYRGSFTAFGIPTVKMGDIVDLQDSLYPENGGRYWVDEVVVTAGMDGFRRQITLGPKA
ncbi:MULTISPECIES: hypothetical protein [Nostocales]|jgi:hypothetical protein|uniref:hypothetical protein n=1 Tax=Nostocales TaxID=1161 RepID=UPI00232F0172|nr:MULTISPECIES: hypothetical protein [Aphanizomenonaceae]MDB9476797.1 hypothetical protein [Dolichospermum circinale CS-537/11]MDB9498570.1 hypothetical protein [Nodularia spumigena CS-336/02]